MLRLSIFAILLAVVCCHSVRWGEWEDFDIARQKFWVPRNNAKDTEIVDLIFGLHLRNIDQFTSQLLDVSDPKSANYGISNNKLITFKN